MNPKKLLKNIANWAGLLVASLAVLVAVFIVFPPVDVNLETSFFKLNSTGTDITFELFGAEHEIKYNFDGHYTDYKTIYYETAVRDEALIIHDADVLRARLAYLGTNLYDLTAIPEEGRIKLTIPAWIDETKLEQYITQKGQLTFVIYTQPDTSLIEATEGATDAETAAQTAPMVSSVQFLDGDIASASYSELADQPTVELRFSDPAELATRVPASVFRRAENQTVYVSLDSNNLGQSTQTIYQLNGEAPAIAAYKTPWGLKTLTLAIYPSSLLGETTDGLEVTPELVYRLLNYGQLKTDWTLSQTAELPSAGWQPVTLLLVPLVAITTLSIYLLITRKRIEWLIFITEGIAVSLFFNALFIRISGLSISPFTIPAYALTTLVFAWTIGHAADQSSTKLSSGATVYTSMRAAIAEAKSDVLLLLVLISATGLFSGIAALTIMSVTAITYILALFVIEHSISKRLLHEEINEKPKK